VVIVFIGLGWGLLTMQIILLSYQLMKVKHFKLWKMSFLTSSVATILVIMVWSGILRGAGLCFLLLLVLMPFLLLRKKRKSTKECQLVF
jgi:hypothetical protein